MLSFELPLEGGERAEPRALEFADPTLRDLVDGDGIEEMKLLAALPLGRDQVGFLENGEMPPVASS